MPRLITQIDKNGLAYRHGLRIGDGIITINNEELIDQIDYQYLTSQKRISLHVEKADKRLVNIEIINTGQTPLGMRFDDSLISRPRQCRNKCTFCFIDQMPKGMRDSLYVKDDDWRLSLMMGNYITLTNVDDMEFERIMRRKASPLYISVHATNPVIRKSIMRNPNAENLMERLIRFKDAGIRFHCQIVLCPGVNDGSVLDETLCDLSGLYPASSSVALVPVGLTAHRSGLENLELFNKTNAETVLKQCSEWQHRCLQNFGTRFVFPADELICIANREIPDNQEYEDYPQIENGVGMLRAFENELGDAAKYSNDIKAVYRHVTIACGTSVAPQMRKWMHLYAPPGVTVNIKPIINHFFGPSITVSGLLTGADVMKQLADTVTDEILLCKSMLSDDGLFLDDIPFSVVNDALTAPVTIVPNNGESMYKALLGSGC